MDINKLRKLLQEKEIVGVKVRPDYFREGDYSSWYDSSEASSELSYKEWLDMFIDDMSNRYNYLILYNDGTLYGVVGGSSYDISYDEFKEDDVNTFLRLAEKYGYEIV